MDYNIDQQYNITFHVLYNIIFSVLYTAQGEVVDYSLHLLPAGLSAVVGDVIPQEVGEGERRGGRKRRRRRRKGMMAGVSLSLEGKRGFKVRLICSSKK